MKTQPPRSFKSKVSSMLPLKLLVSLVLVLLNTQILHAEIESISEERLGQGESQSYWEVDVTCTDESESINIRQSGGQSSWCTESGAMQTCDDSKKALADKICNTALLSILKSSNQQAEAEEDLAASQAKQAAEAEQAAQLRRQRERQQQARNQQQAETNRLKQEQNRLTQERNILNQERRDIQNLDLDLTQKLKEIEEKLKELE